MKHSTTLRNNISVVAECFAAEVALTGQAGADRVTLLYFTSSANRSGGVICVESNSICIQYYYY